MTDSAGLYGQSLYELARRENLTEEITGEAVAVKKILDVNPDYITLLSEPSIPKAKRLSLLDDAFRGEIQPYLLNFLKLLLENNMLRSYGGCVRKMRQLYNQDHGIAEAVVTSAVALTADQMNRLQKKLESYSGKRVEITQKTNPGVLGGIRVEMDGELLDGTVKGRLDTIRKRVEQTVV